MPSPTLADVVAVTNHALTMRAPVPPPAGARMVWSVDMHAVPVHVAHQLLATRDDLPWYVEHVTENYGTPRAYARVRLDRVDLPRGEGELCFFTERVAHASDLPVAGRTL